MRELAGSGPRTRRRTCLTGSARLRSARSLDLHAKYCLRIEAQGCSHGISSLIESKTFEIALYASAHGSSGNAFRVSYTCSGGLFLFYATCTMLAIESYIVASTDAARATHRNQETELSESRLRLTTDNVSPSSET